MRSATNATALVSIRELHVQRGRKSVLRVERLDILPGEVMAVVGPNGAGKSSLLLALARLIRPKSATILFNNQPTEREPDLVYRRRIAMVLQTPLLFDMSVFDNVASGLRFRGEPKQAIAKRVDQWLERLGIAHLRDRRGGALSGGEAQRACIARAMVLEPQLLLLDEPFSALDPPTRRRLSADFAQLLSETQTTTIIVTHDFDEAAKLAHRMAIILNGQLRRVDTPQALLSATDDPDIAAFLGG